MPLIRSLRETIHEQLTDPQFRCEFLPETAANMVAGDPGTAKSVLLAFINGTAGFIALGEALSR